MLSIERVMHPTTDHQYEIIAIAGMPFYQSSGQTSAFANTWFPFFGVTLTENGLYPAGWLIKAFSNKLAPDTINQIKRLFPSYGSADAGRQLLTRFWSEPCLLISATLGGGLWQEERGQQLKTFLKSKYPDYFLHEPQLLLKPARAAIPENAALNQWLCEQAKVDNHTQLMRHSPNTVETLQTRLQSNVQNQKKPKASTRNPPSKSKRLPIKLVHTVTPRVKKPISRKVKFVELNANNGERPFQMRNRLRQNWKLAVPKRQDEENPLRQFLQTTAAHYSQRIRYIKYVCYFLLMPILALSFGMLSTSLMGITVLSFTALALGRVYAKSAPQAPLLTELHKVCQSKTSLEDSSLVSGKTWLARADHHKPLPHLTPIPAKGILKNKVNLR